MLFNVICFYEKFVNFVIDLIEVINLRSVTSKIDIIHTNIQINAAKLVQM